MQAFRQPDMITYTSYTESGSCEPSCDACLRYGCYKQSEGTGSAAQLNLSCDPNKVGQDGALTVQHNQSPAALTDMTRGLLI